MKSPGFSWTVVVRPALGIGATTTIFSFVDGVLLKPLNYRESGQLVVAWEHVGFLEKLFPYVGPNPRHAAMWRQSQTGLSSLALVSEGAAGVGLRAMITPAMWAGCRQSRTCCVCWA